MTPPISAPGNCRRDCTRSSACLTNIPSPKASIRAGASGWRARSSMRRPKSGLDRDSGLTDAMTPREAVVRLDSFVCDVKDTLVADGLHIFGRVPPQPDGEPTEMPYEACAAGERAALLAALDGQHVTPGPAGSPWRGRRDVLPTGRNLFTVDCRAVPSRTAAGQGEASRRCLADPASAGSRRLSAQRDAGSLGFGDHAHRRRGIRDGSAADGRGAGMGHHFRAGHGF